MLKLERHRLLGLPLCAPSTAEFIAFVRTAAGHPEQAVLISYLNAATFNLAYEDPDHARRLEAFDCVYADGQAVVWGARARRIPIPERVNAGDFTQEMMQALAADGRRVALIGGRAGEAERAAERFRGWAPRLQIVLARDGYFPEQEAGAIAAQIDRADPDLVLLGMGAPRQEQWACRWAGQGRPRVWWCVGALFEYYAGARRRAPRWVRRIGMEWAFRLMLEPCRLWQRYLIGNPLFILRLLRGRPPAGLSPAKPR